MSFDFNNDIPIYLQIIDHIKLQIINKKYLPNDKIPSVRELSLIYSVNPNTIQFNKTTDRGHFTTRSEGRWLVRVLLPHT